MDMSGLLHQITSNWVNNTDSDTGNDEFRPLTYRDTLFPFLIISGGFMIVLGITLIESLTKRSGGNNGTQSERVASAWTDH